MDTDAHTPPSDEELPELEDWFSLPEDKKVHKLEKVAQTLREESTIEKFRKECENIGQTAVAIDTNFRRVEVALSRLAKTYGREFPEVDRVFVPKWDGLRTRWGGKDGILWSSREFASTTAAALGDYGTNLQIVADITTQKSLEDAQANLKRYIEDHPKSDGKTIADGFKILSRDVGDFSRDFKSYMTEQGQTLTTDAQEFKADIAKHQAEVDYFNTKIKDAAISLGCTWIFGLVALIPLGFLIHFAVERNKAQANLNKAKKRLRDTVQKQQALAAIQTGFETLKPDIDDICLKLGIFAGIWAFMTGQSIEIDEGLRVGLRAVTDRKFMGTVDILIAQVKPLQEGLRTYAQQIVKK